MKRFTRLSVCLPLLLLLASALLSGCVVYSARDDEDASSRIISVAGQAEREVEPDEMSWSVTVRVERPAPEAAADTLSLTLERLITLLDVQGVPEEARSTTRVRLMENTRWVDGRQQRLGFVAEAGVAFTSSNLDAYLPLWSGLAAIDGLRVDQVAFGLADREAALAEVRRQALRNAEAKARELARELGAELGPVLRIEEPGAAPVPLPVVARFETAALAADAGGSAPPAGRIRLAAVMQASWSLAEPEE